MIAAPINRVNFSRVRENISRVWFEVVTKNCKSIGTTGAIAELVVANWPHPASSSLLAVLTWVGGATPEIRASGAAIGIPRRHIVTLIVTLRLMGSIFIGNR